MTNLEGARYLTLHEHGQELRVWLEPPELLESAAAPAAHLATLLAPAIARSLARQPMRRVATPVISHSMP